MKLLAEISEASLGLPTNSQDGKNATWRKSARAIVLNNEGKMAVQYLQTYAFHKLPGGGVDEGEMEEAAAQREVREEVGCECEILRPIGVTIEYRTTEKIIQVSHCYEASVKGSVGVTALEPGEIEEGQVTLWLSPEEVLEKMKTDHPKKMEGHFILKREI